MRRKEIYTFRVHLIVQRSYALVFQKKNASNRNQKSDSVKPSPIFLTVVCQESDRQNSISTGLSLVHPDCLWQAWLWESNRMPIICENRCLLVQQYEKSRYSHLDALTLSRGWVSKVLRVRHSIFLSRVWTPGVTAYISRSCYWAWVPGPPYRQGAEPRWEGAVHLTKSSF